MTESLNSTLGTENVIWNLADLYPALDDPALAADLKNHEAEAQEIRAGFAGRLAELDAATLLELVSRLEKLEAGAGRISTFAFLNFAANTKNAEASAFMQKVREAGSRIGKETVFFELEWNRVPQERAERLLDEPLLAPYRHYLAGLRRYAPHLLSDAEETLLIEKAPAGRGSWTTLFDKVMGHLKFGPTGRSEEEVLSDLYLPDREQRRQAAAELTAGLNSQLHVLTHTFNTLLADKMIDDRLRRYPDWLSSMNLHNELQDRTVVTLVEAVTSRYDIPQRYYRLKRRLLGLEQLTDYDRYAPLPHLPTTTVPWEQCRQMVLDSFAQFSPEMAAIGEKFFSRGWIHAPLLEGKRGGAFAHPAVPEVHPYIMVNYTGNLRDISTVAHELGHGVHQYLAASQGYYNSSTPLVLAETASVFAELLLFNSQLELLRGAEARRAFICQKLESIFATVFRQVAMNRFEDRVHRARREQGELSAEEIASHWRATQQAMFADSVALSDDYMTWWSYIPHFLSTPGYVYSYAFGELLVLALYRLYQQDREVFVPKYLELLRAGGGASPYRLVEPFGVDLDDPRFWEGGLEVIDEMLAGVERDFAA
ncbi:M3 family oligoendopeptidase [Desulfurivibrio sp. D14AmB]|uniref:M3 family oligoendopeptidase n=1 Tax=Desulfurivibrio sp. D14AmB TaxID=3374370 RepID=UPI00376EE8D4